MQRIFSLLVMVAVALSLAMGMGVGTIAAQEDTNGSGEVYPGDQAPDAPDENESADDGDLEDEQNATGEPTVEPNDEFMQEIDTNTRITDWSYSPGMFTLTIEADEPTKVSMTEAGTFEQGTGTFNYQEVSLDEGSNTITFSVTAQQGTNGGAGVAIATARSLEQGGGAYVSTGMVEQNPFRHFGGESGLFSGVIMTTVLAGVGAWYVVRSEESGVVQA